MNIIKSVAKIFAQKRKVISIPIDPTEYRITTTAQEYHGVIIAQDDFSINFRCQKNKTVKIPKSSIKKITLVINGNDQVTSTRSTVTQNSLGKHE